MSETAAPRYNVLEIMTDQHQAEAMGHEGHPQAITPNMDRLATEGVRFSQAYTANPICTPTRVSVLSGQYCHNHGYYGLSGPHPDNLPDFLSYFGRHGYRTAILGKTHLPNDPIEWLRDRVDLHVSMGGDKASANPHVHWCEAQGVAEEIDHGSIPDLPGKQQNEARPSKLTYRQTVEGFTNQLAMNFIDKHANQPWAMQVSYYRPHQCYTPPQEFWDLYDEDLDLPHGFGEDQSHRPAHFQRMARNGVNMEGNYEPTDPRERARRVWHGYLGCISLCDHAIGELLDHLEQRGLLDNTIVVYHSDHGAYSGMFGVPEKAPGICSEHVCRVPMLWRVPGVTPKGHHSTQFVENVDLAPTFASLCGLPAPDWVDGKDITPLLKGGDQPLRDVSVTENAWSKSLRWKQWRFVHYQPEMFGGENVGELYDIEADPYETNNLYHDPAHAEIVSHGRHLVLQWLIRTTRNVTCHPDGGNARRDTRAADGTQPNGAGPAHCVEQGQLNYI